MEKHINTALMFVEKSMSNDHKHGAVCVIGEEFGPVWTKAVMQLPPGTNMRRVKLLVVRKGMKMSKPCQRVIEGFGVRRVWWCPRET